MAPPTPPAPPAGPPQAEGSVHLLTHSRGLGERVYVHSLVGAIVGLLIVLGSLVARYVVGVGDLDSTALVLLGLTIAVYNAMAGLSVRPFRDPEASVQAQRRLLRVMIGTTILDYLALTVAIWFVGGTRSPFLPFYLVHVILSCLLLSRGTALLLHWCAYGLLALLVVGEWTGVLPPPHLPPGAVGGVGPLDDRYAITVLVVYAVLFFLTAYLLLGLARMLRHGEEQLRLANDELQRLSAMRRDFLRIALHNLQSPIGVVTMFLNNLKAGLGGQVSEQQATWVNRSLERLTGVKDFMHDLQMLSTLESGRIEARAADVDVRNMLGDLAAENEDLARSRGHTVAVEVPDDVPAVRGIELLVREAVANFITNAVKYTPEGGRITLRAVAHAPFVRIEVSDTGVGISSEDQARLFSEFVRIRGKDAPVGRTRGTGLGLTIVKRVAEVHGGRAGVESVPGRGSTFYLDLPAVAT